MKSASVLLSAALKLVAAAAVGAAIFFFVRIFSRPAVAYALVVAAAILAILLFSPTVKNGLAGVVAVAAIPFLGMGLAAVGAAGRIGFNSRSGGGKAECPDALSELEKSHAEAKKVALYVDYCTNFPVVFDEETTVFDDKAEFLDSVCRDVGRAEKSVFIELGEAKRGAKFAELEKNLYEALSRGVKVRIAVDKVGAYSVSRGGGLKALSERGAKIKSVRGGFSVFGGIRGGKRIYAVDGEAAFIGGADFSDEKKTGIAGLRLTGDAAKQIDSIGHRIFGENAVFPLSDKNCGGGFVQPFCASNAETVEGIYNEIFSLAKREVLICSPELYFADSTYKVLEAVCAAGAAIKVVTSKGESGVRNLLSRASATRLFSLGAEIMTLDKEVLDEKYVAIDGSVAVYGLPAVGFGNQNGIEGGAIFYDNRVIDRLVTDFGILSAKCSRFDEKSKIGAFGNKLANFLAYFI